MNINFYKRDLKNIIILNYQENKNIKLINIFKNIPEKYNNDNIYFVDNNNNIVKYINKTKIINFLLKKENFYNITVENLPDFDNLPVLKNDDNLIYVYNIMRNKYNFLPVKDNNTGKLLGELYYLTISKKFYDILLKDSVLNTYNQELLKLLIKKYKNLFENLDMGIIGIKPLNLNIITNFYGNKFVSGFLKKLAFIIINTLRRIDMVFWQDNTFYLIVFNSKKEILNKISNRIKNNLEKINLDNVYTTYIIETLSIPEEEQNFELGLDKIKYLIKKEELKLNKF